jgi:hypothetical protein
VLKFLKKYKGTYKIILVKKKYLIDIREDNENYCESYLNRKKKRKTILFLNLSYWKSSLKRNRSRRMTDFVWKEWAIEAALNGWA